MALDKIRFHSISSTLTDTTDHNVFSFNINVDNGIKLTSKSIYPNFYKADFGSVNDYLLGIN